ncbi:MAG: DNA polymerase I [Deltaproteobacteria bacterium]|jgi:DNA polymerase-1|nr:DNA polymerase I [Deltaproteobacteria bacterium]
MDSQLKTDKTIYLMDASAFTHRAFFALRRLSTAAGFPTGAAYGFTSSLLKLLKDKNPHYVGVIYDGGGKGRRYQIYPEYKANRPPMDENLAAQQAPIRNIVKAMGILGLEATGFEADDIIAAYTKAFSQEGHNIVIVSGDKDFYQLLAPNVSMYDPDSSKKSALNLESFTERFEGITPAQFLEMQALMGDTSDNIPGVPRIGEKKALVLIKAYGSLEGIYKNLDKITPPGLRENLSQNHDKAEISRELALLGATYKTEHNFEDFALGPMDKDALKEIFTKLEFKNLMRELDIIPSLATTSASGKQSLLGDNASDKEPGAIVERDKYLTVDSEENWKLLESALQKAHKIAVDLETDSLSPSTCNIVGISLATEPNLAFYIPIGHGGLFTSAQDQNQDIAITLKRLAPYLTDKDKFLYGQNAKFDWHILDRFSLTLEAPKGDPRLASYLLNPDAKHNLDALSEVYLKHTTISFKEVAGSKKNFADVTISEATKYSGEDADLTLRLAGILEEKLKNTSQKLEDLYHKVELPLEGLLVKMERAGVLVNPKKLKTISKNLSLTLASLAEKIYEDAGEEFNISSPKQVSRILFEVKKLPVGKKTAKKTGYSTDNEVLSELALTYPIASYLLTYRETEKLKTTYADKLPLSINKSDGRIHTTFNQAQTATGRLSSSDPNLQNIPAKTEEGRRIREAFEAQSGYELISADYSQIELRVMAEFSKDPSLLAAFQNDEDIHRETAAQVFGLAPDQVGPDERRKAKAINFGVIYGQGPFGLAKVLKISQGAARDFIDLYFKRFPGVKDFMEETKKKAVKTGYVETLYGRRRYLEGIRSSNHQIRTEAERMAINTPVQGTAADIIKVAMLRVAARLAAEYPKARLILQVHDELIVECPKEDKEALMEILSKEMVAAGTEAFYKGAPILEVPLKVDSVASPNWTHA